MAEVAGTGPASAGAIWIRTVWRRRRVHLPDVSLWHVPAVRLSPSLLELQLCGALLLQVGRVAGCGGGS